MNRIAWPSGRKLRVIAAVVGLPLALGLGLVWSRRDPWSPRVVITAPAQSRPNGFRPDGRTFQTSSPAGTAAWDVATGQAVPAWPGPAIIRQATSADGRSFVGVVANEQSTDAEVVWGDAASGAIRGRFSVPDRYVVHPRFLDQDRAIRAVLLDTTRVREVATWDRASGTETRRPITGPGSLGLARTVPVAHSPDGRIWAYFDVKRIGVQLWDAEADQPLGGLLRTPTTRLTPWSTAGFTPDSQTLLLTQDDGRVEFWDVANSRLIRTVKIHSNGFYGSEIALAPDGRTLASAANNPQNTSPVVLAWVALYWIAPGWVMQATREVVILDVATGRPLARSRGSNQPQFSPDGRTIVTHEWDDTFSIRSTPDLKDGP